MIAADLELEAEAEHVDLALDEMALGGTQRVGPRIVPAVVVLGKELDVVPLPLGADAEPAHAAVVGVYLNGKQVPDKLPLRLEKGDVLRLEVPGAGGMYPPAERDPRALARDMADGLVTRAAALRDYGRAAGLRDAAE